ncbi:MAG TPA: IPTL-CTERM sorting domain-containing protein, partial [Thermoanaerobaculia bacterium]|nr:IPTL-CTERM sorting domain-containing protein [Thermoanaerobaculia bacterium]
DPSAPGSFPNPRSGGACAVDPDGAVTEAAEGNNACSDTMTITDVPDLTLTKTNDTSGVGEVGTPFTWSLRVDNGGGAAASFSSSDPILIDNLPSSGLAYGTPSVSSSSGLTGTVGCTIVASNLACSATTAVTLAAGGHVTVSFTATPSADGTYDNPRSGGGCLVDDDFLISESDESNNTCSDSVVVAPLLPDLEAVKSNDVGGAGAVGVAFTWTIAVSNSGTGEALFAAGEVVLRDDLPAGATYGAFTVGSSSGLGGGGTLTCSEAADVLTCAASGGTVTIAPGGGFSVAGAATPTAAGLLTNPAAGGVCAVDPGSVVDEQDESDNECGDALVVAGPDLTVAKSNDGGGTAEIGVPFSWTLTVENAGAGVADFAVGEILLRDDLPPGATYGAFTAGSLTGISGAGSLACGVAADVLTCTASGGGVRVEPGGGFAVAGPVTPTESGMLENPPAAGVCAVDPDGRVAEDDEANNECSDDVVVSAPDLVVGKTAEVGPRLQLGDVIVFTLSYLNQGNRDAAGTVLTETVPALTEFVPAQSTAGWSCAPDDTAGSTCELTVGTVAPGDGGSAEFAVRVVAGDPGDLIENIASIADDGSNGDDANPADNEASVAVAIGIAIPTLGEWGLVILVLLLAAMAVRRIRLGNAAAQP